MHPWNLVPRHFFRRAAKVRRVQEPFAGVRVLDQIPKRLRCRVVVLDAERHDPNPRIIGDGFVRDRERDICRLVVDRGQVQRSLRATAGIHGDAQLQVFVCGAGMVAVIVREKYRAQGRPGGPHDRLNLRAGYARIERQRMPGLHRQQVGVGFRAGSDNMQLHQNCGLP